MMTIEGIKERCRKALVESPALRAMVFGSYAQGSQTRRSDIDIIVIGDTDKPFFQRFEDFAALYEAFKDEVIDLLIYTPGEFADMAHRRFIRTIMAQGVVVYER
jgi:predicted nucleotidyltransferase